MKTHALKFTKIIVDNRSRGYTDVDVILGSYICALIVIIFGVVIYRKTNI